MSNYAFGDVLLVPFPFTNQSGVKKRPAVVVSSNAYNASRPDVLIMAITSQLHAGRDFAAFPITGWQAAGLLKPSLVKPVITTLEQTQIIRRMGCLSPDDLALLRQMLRKMIG